MMNKEAVFTKDLPNNTIKVARAFDAPLDLVWKCWTEAPLLDQWWAPKPFKAETKSMDFQPGGKWIYCMVGPNGEAHWCRVDYTTITPQTTVTSTSVFCDPDGNANNDLPAMHWQQAFHPYGETTQVDVEIRFDKAADLQAILTMGFQEGFTAGLNNLDQYLETHFLLRKEMKPHNRGRVTTYLNFPGNTEEAFLFYRDVFKGEFTGAGLQRFGDAALPADAPPLNPADKKLIIHAELTILGGHILMATDAPESMGFKVEYGNNMHINVEPESREETQRLFDALAKDGKITMPLQDMFWGAFFGSVTDKYGINWFLNFQQV